jgi:UDP-N-acetylmuramoyl-tripeptide--D-alanyl-D-alanine ligase
MRFMTCDDIRGALGGRWLARPSVGECSGVSVDSRTAREGHVFLALKGRRTDGHRFLADARARGAAVLVVSCEDAGRAACAGENPPGVLLVPDTGRALLRLAGAYRRMLEGTRVVAVGGSNGKTTTVRLVHAVLSRALRGSHSPSSFNNAVGLPLTVLAARRGDQYLVCEIGTNAPGEIAPLAGVAEPDIAVITSIGREHLEGLGSLEGVLREEVSLLQSLRPGGLAVLNADAPGLVEAARPIIASRRASLATFGASPQADLRLTRVEQDGDGVSFEINGRLAFRVPLLGVHNAWNAAAAVAAGRRLGLTDSQIGPGLERAEGPPMRLQVVEAGGVRVLNDAYNANPESVLASLEAFGSFGAGAARRVIVLGDMLELGSASPQAHAEVVRAAAGLRPHILVLVGPMMVGWAAAAAAESPGAVRVVRIADPADVSKVAGLLHPGDAVLLKGSRGMALERVLDALREANRGPCSTSSL